MRITIKSRSRADEDDGDHDDDEDEDDDYRLRRTAKSRSRANMNTVETHTVIRKSWDEDPGGNQLRRPGWKSVETHSQEQESC